MRDSILAERIKYFSTPGWALGALALLLLGMLMPIGNTINANVNGSEVGLGTAMDGVDNFGLVVLMAIAAMFVTQEYRYGVVKESLLATPSRVQWLTAKGIFIALVAIVSATVMGVLGVLAVSWLADSGPASSTLWSDAAPMIARAALITCAMTALAVAVGAVLRSTPAAVTLIIAWPTVIELLLSRLPGLTELLPPYLLFSNVVHGVIGDDLGVSFPWGAWGSVAYLAGIAVIAFTVAAVITARRSLPN